MVRSYDPPPLLMFVHAAATLRGMTGPQRDPLIPDLMSVTEVAELFNRKRQTILWMINQGHLKAAQAGTTWVIRREYAERMAKGIKAKR